LVKYYDKIVNYDIDKMSELLKDSLEKLVKPHPDHMKTVITGVMLTSSPISDELKPVIKKYKYKKAFKFYMYGWAEIRLIVIDLSSKQVLCNPAGKEVQKFYEGLFVDDR